MYAPLYNKLTDVYAVIAKTSRSVLEEREERRALGAHAR